MHNTTTLKVMSIVLTALAVMIMLFSLGFFHQDPEPFSVEGALRNVPLNIFYSFGIAVILLLALLFKFLFVDLPRAGNMTRKHAAQMTNREWFVKSASVFSGNKAMVMDAQGWQEVETMIEPEFKGSAGILVSSTDLSREEVRITFRPTHPSVSLVESLTYLDRIRFELTDKPLECALDTELCAHLTIKV
jgi:hypothetical protein